MKKYFSLLVIAFAIAYIQAYSVADESTSKAELGKFLFFDPVLSKDYTISCASCHKPAFAFADSVKLSLGVRGQKGTRNTPSAMNLSLQRIFFWDGRAKSLEEQVLHPIQNPAEMNLPIEEALLRLQSSKKYMTYFSKIFNSEPTRENLAAAIAAFERTLETSNSPFDNWKFSGNAEALNESAKRGFAIFNEKGKCIKCHFGADFTTHEFRNIGLFNGKELNDSGRSVISGNKQDIGKFKVPGLRNIAITAPYMHNGQFKTLRQVIEFYNNPDKVIPNSINRDSVMAKPLGLTRQEMDDLEEFLISFTDKRFSLTRE